MARINGDPRTHLYAWVRKATLTWVALTYETGQEQAHILSLRKFSKNSFKSNLLVYYIIPYAELQGNCFLFTP